MDLQEGVGEHKDSERKAAASSVALTGVEVDEDEFSDDEEIPLDADVIAEVGAAADGTNQAFICRYKKLIEAKQMLKMRKKKL